MQPLRAAMWHSLVSWKGHVLAALSAAANSPATGHQTEGFIQAPCVTDPTHSRPGVMGWLWNGCGPVWWAWEWTTGLSEESKELLLPPPPLMLHQPGRRCLGQLFINI